jgi:hypothetical protein
MIDHIIHHLIEFIKIINSIIDKSLEGDGTEIAHSGFIRGRIFDEFGT